MSSRELLAQQQTETSSEVPSSDFPLPSSLCPVKRALVEDNTSEQCSDVINNDSEAPKTVQDDKIPPTTVVSESQKPLNPRLAALHSKQANLEAKLADLQARRTAMVAQAKMPSGLDMPEDWSDEQKTKHALAGAQEVIREHIALLHSYNDIKDVGLGLMGMVAEKRGVRQTAIVEEFGLSQRD